MTDKNKNILTMCINLDKCAYGDGYELTGRVCFIDPSQRSDDCELGEMTGFGLTFGIPDKWRDLEDLRFHLWIRDDGTSYGGDGVRFDAGSYVSMDEADRMHRASARIRKALDKITKERGYAADEAEQFGRLASAIGCSTFLETRPVRRSHQQYRYIAHSGVGEAVNRVRQLLRDLKEKHAETVTP